eukprot:12418875-Karenia_brevis.AAC.1
MAGSMEDGWMDGDMMMMRMMMMMLVMMMTGGATGCQLDGWRMDEWMDAFWVSGWRMDEWKDE